MTEIKTLKLTELLQYVILSAQKQAPDGPSLLVKEHFNAAEIPLFRHIYCVHGEPFFE